MSLWMGILTFSLLCLCLFLQLRQVNGFLREHNAPALPPVIRQRVTAVSAARDVSRLSGQYARPDHVQRPASVAVAGCLAALAATSFYQRILVCRPPGPAAARRAVSVAAAGAVQQRSDVLSYVGRVVEREKTLRT